MRKAGDVLKALFNEMFGPGFYDKARSASGVFSGWSYICAEAFKAKNNDIPAAASHSRIKDIEKGVLLVEADHPGWVQTLRAKQQEILFVARRRYPELEIKEISFFLAREPFCDSGLSSLGLPADALLEPTRSDLPSGGSAAPNRKDKKDASGDPFYKALYELEESVKKNAKKSAAQN